MITDWLLDYLIDYSAVASGGTKGLIQRFPDALIPSSCTQAPTCKLTSVFLYYHPKEKCGTSSLWNKCKKKNNRTLVQVSIYLRLIYERLLPTSCLSVFSACLSCLMKGWNSCIHNTGLCSGVTQPVRRARTFGCHLPGMSSFKGDRRLAEPLQVEKKKSQRRVESAQSCLNTWRLRSSNWTGRTV